MKHSVAEVRLKQDLDAVDKILKNVSFKRLNSSMVETGWLSEVTIAKDGTIQLSKSWTELLLILFSIIYEQNPNRFMGILVDNHVLSDGVNVHNSYIKYPASSGIKYEVYKLKDTPYYIEFRCEGKTVIKAIKGLMSALKIDNKSIKFKIEPIQLDVNSPKKSYAKAGMKRINKTLQEIIDTNELSIEVKSITINKAKENTTSTSQALALFIAWASSVYGDKELYNAMVKCKNTEVGTATAGEIDEIGTFQYRVQKIGDNYIYFSSHTPSILRFIYNVALHLGVNTSSIKLGYDVIKVAS